MNKTITIDFYTKFILTIISLCLVWICLRQTKVTPYLYAGSPEKVVDVRIKAVERDFGERWVSLMIDTTENFPVEVRNHEALPVGVKESIELPVKVKNELLPVDVKNVEVKRTLDPLERK